MKKVILVGVALMFFAFSSKGQIIRGLIRSAANQAVESTQDRANKEVEKKVDKEINKMYDNILKEDSSKTKKEEKSGSTSSSESEAGMPQSLSRLMGAMGTTANVKKKDMYLFSSQIVMEMEIRDGEGNAMPATTSEIFFNDKNNDFGMKSNAQGAKTTFIFDFENKCTLFLTDNNGKKSGFATTLNPDELKKYTPEESATTQEAANEEECFKRTGNTKNINGFSCEEYLCDSEESTIHVWLTKELDKKINRAFNSNMMGGNYSKASGMNGAAIVYHFKSKKDKSESKSTLKSFDLNKSSSFSTVGYEIVGLSLGAK